MDQVNVSPALYAVLGVVVTKLVDWGIARGGRQDTYTDGLRKDIDGLRKELAAKDARVDALEQQIDQVRDLYRQREAALYRRIDQLDARVTVLTRHIQRHGLDVPAEQAEGKD